MFRHPFALLQPFNDQLSVTLLTRSDRIHTDAELSTRLHATSMASLWQVHGNRTIIIRSETSRQEQADGFITDQKKLTLTIRSADCQTFFVYAPSHDVVGLLHVGWRGIVAEAIPAFFQTMLTEWNIDAIETYVCAGPSLCQKCAEFSDPASELTNVPATFVQDRHVDLRGAADQQLVQCGVLPERLERNPDCTCCANNLYWSYRGIDREAVKNGYTNVLACTLL